MLEKAIKNHSSNKTKKTNPPLSPSPKDRSLYPQGGAHGVMVTVLGNGHGDASSNPGRD